MSKPTKVSALDPEIIHTSFVYNEIQRSLENDDKTPFQLPPLTTRETECLRQLLKDRISYCRFIGGIKGQRWEAKIEDIVLATFEIDRRNKGMEPRRSDFVPGAISTGALKIPIGSEEKGGVTKAKSFYSLGDTAQLRTGSQFSTGSQTTARLQPFKTKSTTPTKNKPHRSESPKPLTPSKRLVRKRTSVSWWEPLSYQEYSVLILKSFVMILIVRYISSRGLIQTLDAIAMFFLSMFGLALKILAVLAEAYLAWWKGWQQSTIGGFGSGEGL